jgi:cell division protein FtsW
MAFLTAPRRSLSARLPELNLGRKHRPDYLLLILCAILLSIGLIVVYAISPALAQANHTSNNYYVTKQLIAITLSLVAFFVTANVPLSVWRQAYKPLIIIAALATLMALILPVNPAYPAHRWVRLGSFSFQSVELVKFAIMIWLAGFLAQQIQSSMITNFKKSLKPIIVALVAIALAVAGIQSDLGSAGVMLAMMITMAFVAGLPFKRMALVVLIIFIVGTLAISITPYRRARLQSYLHPTANCQSTGYQACQALIAVGSGGIIGLGLGSSVQAYGYLPEAANDSIFAIYAEKFGFIGSTLLLGVMVAFFARMKTIAERTTDNFSRLIVMGVLSWLSVQAFINIGSMLGLLPLKGITLPFISYGGTSVVFVSMAVGLVFQISKYTSFTTSRLASNSLRSASTTPKAAGIRQ